MTDLTKEFERVTCGRCGGTGRYSYNQISGSTCFGCGGKGTRLTKRGDVAARMFRASQMVKATEIKVGDLVVDTMFAPSGASARYQARVVELSEDTETYSRCNPPVVALRIAMESKKFGRVSLVCFKETEVHKCWPREVLEAKKAAALALQATLGKNGKPLKGRS